MTKRKPKRKPMRTDPAPATQPVALARLIDDALHLLAERSPTGLTPAEGPPVPLPSLLARCEALLTGGATGPQPLRVVHSFCHGGDGAEVLDHIPNLRRVPLDFAGLPAPEVMMPGLMARARTAAVLTLLDGVEDLGARLVLRLDHAPGQGPLDLGPAPRLMRGVVLVRHPLATYLAARQRGMAVDTLEQFADQYLAFLVAHADLPTLRAEDIAADPAEGLRLMALALDLQVPGGLGVDVDPVDPEGTAEADPMMAHLAVGPAYRALCDRLGYPPAFAAGVPALAAPVVLDWTCAQPDLPLIITCHHKSGTNFLRKVFAEIASDFGLQTWMKFYAAEPEAGWQICFHQHGRVADLLAGRNFRGLHCVRHPKGLIHSAALYHEVCKEPWVDVPLPRFTLASYAALTDRDFYNTLKDPQTPPEQRQHLLAEVSTGRGMGPDFAGRSYRQMLAQGATVADKLLVEMHNFSRGVIGDMVRFPQDRRFALITLEAISRDPQMAALRAGFAHLGFRGPALQKCLDIAAPHCLWKAAKLPAHATTGVSEEWRDLFTGPVEAEYRRLFGAAEQALGYAD